MNSNSSGDSECSLAMAEGVRRCRTGLGEQLSDPGEERSGLDEEGAPETPLEIIMFWSGSPSATHAREN